MTKEFEVLLKLVAAGACGYSAKEIPIDINWEKIEEMARAHGVLPFVGYALKISDAILCPDEIRIRVISDMRQTAFSNNGWKSMTLKLIDEMRREGIPAILIKGYALASCYAAPDCRLSGDTDLMIPAEYEKKACKFMEAKGFHVKPRWKHWHHTTCEHPILGCVELHVQLYDEFVEDIWFKNIDGNNFICEKPVLEKIDEFEYLTLAPTDHLLFLMLHLVKHFIMAGMSLRMMMDVTLYYLKNASYIDEKRIWTAIESLGFGSLVQNILGAIIQYSTINPEQIKGYDEEKALYVDLLLDDLEKGGWLGSNNKREREESGQEYNKQKIMKEKGKKAFYLYMIGRKFGRMFFALFPSYKVLAKQYPFILKMPFLVPIAWIKYFIFRVRQAVQRKFFTKGIGNGEKNISKIGTERLELFKKFDML